MSLGLLLLFRAHLFLPAHHITVVACPFTTKFLYFAFFNTMSCVTLFYFLRGDFLAVFFIKPANCQVSVNSPFSPLPVRAIYFLWRAVFAAFFVKWLTANCLSYYCLLPAVSLLVGCLFLPWACLAKLLAMYCLSVSSGA
jgi:hypothetical protein